MIKSSDVKNKVEIRSANIGDVQPIYETIFESFEPYKRYYTREAYEMTVMTVISHTGLKNIYWMMKTISIYKAWL